jgi:uroporphyrinogen decarboxylase
MGADVRIRAPATPFRDGRYLPDDRERYEHDAIFIHPNPGDLDETFRLIDLIRQRSGDKYFLMMHGDATYAIPNGQDMTEWCAWLYENLDAAKAEADRRVDEMLAKPRPCATTAGWMALRSAPTIASTPAPFCGPACSARSSPPTSPG